MTGRDRLRSESIFPRARLEQFDPLSYPVGKMRDWFLYAPASQLNEATRYYLETIERAARDLGRELRHVTSIAEIPSHSDVLAVESKSAFKLRWARPRARTWLWMQGAYPEEARLQFGSPWRELLWTCFEKYTLPRAQGVFMVSKAMHAHYTLKYGFDRPSFIMPCANAELDRECFAIAGKYEHPSFVYAGSMHKWQCFELTLDVYRLVKARCPDATLTVLTAQQQEARRIIEDAHVKDVSVDFVRLEQLAEFLKRFKYGFVLREKHIVNNVATPTKVSSYMAAGVIPVMTDAVTDYVQALATTQPIIISPHFDAESIAEQILALERQVIEPQAVKASYIKAFADYFDHSRYLRALECFLSRTGLRAD